MTHELDIEALRFALERIWQQYLSGMDMDYEDLLLRMLASCADYLHDEGVTEVIGRVLAHDIA